MEAFGNASDWVLRRLLKVFIKRNLADLLANEIDLQQLSVQLDRGSLELRECLLDSKYINKHLANEILHVESILIGKIKVVVFPPSIVFEDGVFNLRCSETDVQIAPSTAPRSEHVHNSSFVGNKNVSRDSNTPVFEGIKLISQQIHRLLRKVKVSGRNLVARMKLPGDHEFQLNLDSVIFQERLDAQKTDSESFWDVTKSCSFCGLSAQLTATNAEGAAHEVRATLSWDTKGCRGDVDIAVREGNDGEEGYIDVNVGLDGVSVWVSPQALPTMIRFTDIMSVSTTTKKFEDYYTLRNSAIFQGAVTSSKVLEALVLPNGEQVLAEELAAVHGTAQPGEEVDQFFDAVSEYMSQSFLSTASSVFHEPNEKQYSEDDYFKNEKVLSSMFTMNLMSLDFWIECPTETDDCDPWYLRTSIRGMSFSKGSKLDFSVASFEVSEHIPRHMSSGGRTASDCNALISSIATCKETTQFSQETKDILQERPLFDDTITQLKLLKVEEHSCFSPPRTYLVNPIICCGPTTPSLKMSIDSSSSTVSLAFDDIFCWIDLPLLERLYYLSISVFRNRDKWPTNDSGEDNEGRSTAITVSLSSLTFSIYTSSEGALALQMMASPNIAGFNNRGTFFTFLRKEFSGSEIAMKGNVATIYHIAIQDNIPHASKGASMTPLNITYRDSCGLESTKELFINELPSEIARQTETLGGVGSKVKLGGEFYLKSSPGLQSAALTVLECFNKYSNPQPNLDLFFIQLDKIIIAGDCFALEANGLNIFHKGEKTGFLSVGTAKTITATEESRLSALETLGSQEPVASFAIQKVESSLRTTISLQGILLRAHPSILPWILQRTDQQQTNAGFNGASISVEIVASDTLAIFNAADSSAETIVAAISVPHLELSLRNGGKFAIKLGHPSIHLRRGEVRTYPPSNQVATWLSGSEFQSLILDESCSIVREVKNDRKGTRIESINVRNTKLRVILQKGSIRNVQCLIAAFLPEVQERENTASSSPVGAENSSNIQQALLLDVRSNDTQERETMSGWIVDESVAESVTVHQNGRNDVDSDGSLGHIPISNLYIEQYVPKMEEFQIENEHNGNPPMRKVQVTADSISITLIDSLIIPGCEVLEGSFKCCLQDCAINFDTFPAEIGPAHFGTCILHRLHISHDIRSQNSAASSWHEVAVCPHLRREGSAVKVSLQVFSGQAGRTDLRIKISCSPIYIRLDQDWIAFVSDFFSLDNLDTWQFIDKEDEDKDDGVLVSHGEEGLFIEKCHIEGFTVSVTYVPSQIDLGALRKGNIVELLKVMPKWKASLWMRELKLCGIESATSVGTVAATRWMEDILATQMQKLFVIQPGYSSSRLERAVGNTAREFAILPQTATKKEFRKQLQRALVAFLWLLADESREMGNSLAGVLASKSSGR